MVAARADHLLGGVASSQFGKEGCVQFGGPECVGGPAVQYAGERECRDLHMRARTHLLQIRRRDQELPEIHMPPSRVQRKPVAPVARPADHFGPKR